MFYQSIYSDQLDREKLKILQSLNAQIQSMAIKLDHIVTQAEENIFKIKSPNSNNFKETLQAINNSLDTKSFVLNDKLTEIAVSAQIQTSKIVNANQNNDLVKLENNQQLIKIIDQPKMVHKKQKKRKPKTVVKKDKRSKKSIANLTQNCNINNKQIINLDTHNSKFVNQNFDFIKQVQPANLNIQILPQQQQSKQQQQACQMLDKSKKENQSINKRNKQQRIFNTFVRESINQLLGPDFMRTHDVQDIDSQVMEMIRKEAVENYLPDNTRPRRAWHLAKASLRTLKRTLNNRKHKE